MKNQCTAKAKRTGKQCCAPAIKGKTKCRVHGGMGKGPPKKNINAKTHGAYTTTLSTKDKEVHSSVDLDNLDEEIRRNAVLEHRGFELTRDNKHHELGFKLAGEALSRARKLKLSRQEMQHAKDSDGNKPLPWQD